MTLLHHKTANRHTDPVSVASGFTLIEILVVVAIVAIIAAIAIPSYSRFVVHSKLAEAFSMLGDYRLLMEQYNQDNRTYADPALKNCAVPPPANGHYFDIQCAIAVAGTKFTYVATASNKAGQNLGNSGDYSYNINQDGIRNTVSFAGVTGPNGIWKDK